MNKKEIYGKFIFLANLLLIFSFMMFSVYLIAPLVGGKLSTHALMAYASWIGLALAGKFIIKRRLNGLAIRVHDYSLICLVAVANLSIWFAYPVNIILGILCIIVAAVAYRKRAQ